MFKSITFEVVGDQRIVCDGCEQRVKRLLESVDGVDKARADVNNQRIEVLFDAAVVNAAALAERIANAGYQTRVVNSSSKRA